LAEPPPPRRAGGVDEFDEFRTARPIAGWRVVGTAFCMALFAWGFGFYSLSLYVQTLSREAGWSPTLLSAATTMYFLLGAAAIHLVERWAGRYGRRRVAIAGVVLLAAGASALPLVPDPVSLLLAYAAMSVGWAATSGTAVSQVVGDWFERRRGLALNVALTGASAAGFVVVPMMAWGIARWGLAPGLATVAGTLALALIVLIAFNLVESDGSHLAAERRPEPDVTDVAGAQTVLPSVTAGPLVRVTALFAIGWLAQVAFLAQQLPILVPRIGDQAATLAVALTTASSLLGRFALATVIDRIDHRSATAASLVLQAIGMGMVLAFDAPAAVIAGCCLMGLSVGNLITLPAIFAQREFPAAQYGAVVNRVFSIGQLLFAFGPIGAGALQAASGGSRWTLLACIVCQLGAALLCLPLRRRHDAGDLPPTRT
jgi:MFS family permease